MPSGTVQRDHELSFDRENHSGDAIQRAAYRLSDRLSLDLEQDEHVFRCRITIRADDDASVAAVVHDFRNEVLDQVLRERIRRETEGMRNVILSLAFSQTTLVSGD